jgi:hypothetical protein
MNAINLAGAALARCHRDGHGDALLGLKQQARQRRLAGTGGGRDDQHQAAPVGTARIRPGGGNGRFLAIHAAAYSMF